MERIRTGNLTLPLVPVGTVLGAFAVTLLGLSLVPAQPQVTPPLSRAMQRPVQGTLLGRYDVKVETVAGSEPGYRDGAAWEARFNGPNALAAEPDGALLVCDSRNHRIRRITADRRVETVAGGGPTGTGGRSLGAALEARLRYPSGVACDSAGTIYIADTGNHRICRLREGTLSLLAGGTRGSRDGAGAAAAFQFPSTLHYDPAGAVWVAEAGTKRIRRISLTGVTTTPSTIPLSVRNALGRPQRADERTELRGWEPGGKMTSSLEQVWVGGRSAAVSFTVQPPPHELWFNRQTTTLEVYADAENQVVMGELAPDPPMVLAGSRTLAGGRVGSQDGTGETATFAAPAALLWANSALFVADYEGNRIRRVTLPSWMFTTETAPTQ